MEIRSSGGNLQALKAAYMKARDAKDTQEMNRLKAEAMKVMEEEKASNSKNTTDVNVDGDILEISTSKTTR